MMRMQKPDEVPFAKYWNPRISVDNTVGEARETIAHTVVYDTDSWEAYIVERRRVKGVFIENLELFTFPFDTQVTGDALLYTHSSEFAVQASSLCSNLSTGVRPGYC